VIQAIHGKDKNSILRTRLKTQGNNAVGALRRLYNFACRAHFRRKLKRGDQVFNTVHHTYDSNVLTRV